MAAVETAAQGPLALTRRSKATSWDTDVAVFRPDLADSLDPGKPLGGLLDDIEDRLITNRFAK